MINIDSRLAKQLDGDQLKLIVVMTDYINESRECWPSVNTIAKDCSWSAAKVNRVKKSLIQLGLIESRPRFKPNDPGQTSNLYKITAPTQKYIPHSNLTGGVNQNKQGESISSKAEAPIENEGGGVSPMTDKVLGTEVLANEALATEALEIEKRKYKISRGTNLIFEKLIELVYPHFEKYNFFFLDPEGETGLSDPTIISTLKKIGGAAEKLYSAFDQLQRPVPEYREIGMFGSSGGADPLKEAIDQLCAYFDYCDLTGTYTTKDPDKLCEKLVQENWCEKLLEWAEEKVKSEEYDPAYDDKIVSQWLVEHYYCVVISYSCRRYNNRIVYGRTEYLSTKDDEKFNEKGRRISGRSQQQQPVKPNQYSPNKFIQ